MTIRIAYNDGQTLEGPVEAWPLLRSDGVQEVSLIRGLARHGRENTPAPRTQLF